MSTSIVPPKSGRGWRRWWPSSRPVSSLSDATPESHQLDHDLVMSLSTKRIPNLRQLRSLGAVINPSERRWLSGLSWLAIGSGLVVIISLLFSHVAQVPRSGGTLTEGIVGTPQFINPVLARPDTADGEIVSLAFHGLMRVDRNLQIVPDVADTVTRSDDGKTYTVKLRSGLRWSDNEALSADDVVYTYQTILDTQYKSPWASSLRSVTVERQDNRTVVFHLASAVPNFTTLLTIGLIPEHAWGDQTGVTFPLAELNLKPIGNGPYKFTSLTKDRSGDIKSITFVRNKNFADAAPLIDRVVVKFYPDQDSAVQALGASSIDSLGNLRQADLATASKHGRVTNIPIAQLTGVFFSQRTNPALKTLEVRQALALAVDREKLVRDALHGQAKVANGPILPGWIGYNPELKHGQAQFADAAALLEKAGWKAQANGVRQKGSQQLTFVLTTVDDPAFIALARAIADGWKSVGVQVEIKTVDPARIERDVINSRSYEAILFGQRFSADGDPYAYWHSTQQRDPGFALAIFFNKKIDQDLQDARTTVDPAKRTTDYLDFQNIVADQVPAVIIDQVVYAYAHPKNLRGFNAQHVVAPANRFDNLANWYLKTSLTWGNKKK